MNINANVFSQMNDDEYFTYLSIECYLCMCVCVYIDIGINGVVYITVCLPFFLCSSQFYLISMTHR